MNKVKNYDELKNFHELFSNKIKNTSCRILICAGTGCQAGGSAKIAKRFNELTGNDEKRAVMDFAKWVRS